MPSELLELTNLGLEFFVARLCFKLAIISPDFFLVLFNLYVEVFNDFLFVVEAIVETGDRDKVFVKTFEPAFSCCVGFWPAACGKSDRCLREGCEPVHKV